MIATNRREFIKSLGMISGYGLTIGLLDSCTTKPTQETTADSTSVKLASSKDLFFNISLAEWSLHRSLEQGKMTNLDFPAKAKNEFGISAVE